MYFLIGFLLIICIFFFIVHFYRKKCNIEKICCMSDCEKLGLLNQLANPFGFSYLPAQDIMTSRLDAWQKDFGYRTLYDRTAPLFNMVFDCEPVYFHYNNQTWLIEFWKGQYGINIGAEIGVYKTDTLLTPEEYSLATFYGVSNIDFLPMSMKLYFKGKRLFSVRQLHWWLTGFRMGDYCEPEDLEMEISIIFPNVKMLQCFTQSLLDLGYQTCDLCINHLKVSFTFCRSHTQQPQYTHYDCSRFSQWKNKILCNLYQWITRPFDCTIDQILYLYYFLPMVFRRILRFRKNYHQTYDKEAKHHS